MSKFESIKSLLLEIKNNQNVVENTITIDQIIKEESKEFNTYSKFIYDIFIFTLTNIKNSNYTFHAYKSWIINVDTLELFWDGRDDYLYLWETNLGNKKTIKVIEVGNLNLKTITEFQELISQKQEPV